MPTRILVCVAAEQSGSQLGNVVADPLGDIHIARTIELTHEKLRRLIPGTVIDELRVASATLPEFVTQGLVAVATDAADQNAKQILVLMSTCRVPGRTESAIQRIIGALTVITPNTFVFWVNADREPEGLDMALAQYLASSHPNRRRIEVVYPHLLEIIDTWPDGKLTDFLAF